ncbi:16S rRNA m(7)G-527 methyltransferase [Roseivirga pacifica]|uniref:Ribosomal RNA small subunit methyltransferase G n=1 Tax=Roseivirga pacifica TaxID=1267423 RepID=A0A1I0R6C4_9BACT|nr:16S rRNA (guanine(527)-N(7))-methyltransferase RsmG [Roseivirga pacifica]RKQ49038.1 16S rRNA m(7)G-527 methyltransferase [Roseivirga pacifica]SEW35599.1 16S rRNA m(7)G-527 methyltransferase [Roseivirga pacifica]
MNLIEQHFPNLTAQQKEQFAALPELYREWNDKVNVVSRKDIDNLLERHVLHSLGIAKVRQFLPGSDILDVGTGGGFPGIPLAILYPDSQFHLVDSIGKKIRVVNAVAESLGLENVKGEQIRAEQLRNKYDFVVSRAVTRLAKFYPWIKRSFKSQNRHSSLPNGLLYLKGGDLQEELQESNLKKIATHNLSDFFEGEFFDTKKVIYVPAQ